LSDCLLFLRDSVGLAAIAHLGAKGEVANKGDLLVVVHVPLGLGVLAKPLAIKGIFG